jgi:hypothetical protein
VVNLFSFIFSGVIESEVVIEDTIEDKRKNVSRRLDLEVSHL